MRTAAWPRIACLVALATVGPAAKAEAEVGAPSQGVVVPEAFEEDDACLAVGGDGGCALSALQKHTLSTERPALALAENQLEGDNEGVDPDGRPKRRRRRGRPQEDEAVEPVPDATDAMQESTTPKPWWHHFTQAPTTTTTPKPWWHHFTQAPSSETTSEPQESTTTKPWWHHFTQAPTTTTTPKPWWHHFTQAPSSETTSEPQESTTTKPWWHHFTQAPTTSTTPKPWWHHFTQAPSS